MMLCCRTQQHFKHPLQTRNRQEFQSDFSMENFQNTTQVGITFYANSTLFSFYAIKVIVPRM